MFRKQNLIKKSKDKDVFNRMTNDELTLVMWPSISVANLKNIFFKSPLLHITHTHTHTLTTFYTHMQNTIS